jgi:N-succinyldiaminopimelate aminotransferase
VAIPTSAFYDDHRAGRTLVRFAFCKRAAVIEEAVARLTAAYAAG